MKKKILICTLCFTLLFTSINNKKSYANPIITANPIISASLIYAIGHIAYDILGFVGDVTDIIDMGTSVYEKMTEKQKEDIKEQIEFNQEGFTYNESVKDVILPNIPSKGYHYILGFYRSLQSPNIYHLDSSSSSFNSKIFDQHKTTRVYQGVTFEYLIVTSSNSNSDKLDFTFYYKVPSVKDTIYSLYIGSDLKSNIEAFKFELFIISISNGKAWLGLRHNMSGTFSQVGLAYLDDTCSNCPHDNFNPNVNNNYPTSEELEYIDKNYPNLDNDIYDKINPPSDEEDNNTPPSDEEDNNTPPSNGEDNNTPPSNGEGNNTIISNPPKFPNLEAFDFSGLEFEPLSNLFSNFKNKFPFSLPFDLAHLIGYLNQDAVAPVFEANLFGETMSLDLTNFTELANILKLFVVLGYSVGLILLTKRFGG